MILCLGPHRTGTSAVTAAIAALGADLGFASVYANEENQKGFFEHPDLIVLNEKVLGALGGAWDAPAFDGGQALALADPGLVAGLQDEAVAFLDRVFAGSDLAVLKDPRLCVLLGFWLPAIRAAGFDRIYMVHVLRDPAEAAQSQQTRVLRRPEYYEMGRLLPEGAALWLSYMTQMWDGFDQSRHLMLAFDDLVDHPATALGRVSDFLELVPDAAAMAEFATGFLDAGLRHSKGNPDQSAMIAAVLPQAHALYALMRPLAAQGGLQSGDLAAALELAGQTRATLVEIQSAAAARLSNGKRRTDADLARVQDHLVEAEKSAQNLRAEIAKREADLLAELAKRDMELQGYSAELAKAQTAIGNVIAERAALLADRTRVAQEYKKTLDQTVKDFTAQSAALLADRDRVAQEYKKTLDETIAAFESQRAGAEAQSLHDRLVFERDLDLVRQAEAEALALVAAMKTSRSWKITAPLRSGGALARRAAQKIGAGWIWFNHIAKKRYRDISKRSPWLAETLRRLVVPMFRAGNRAILRSDYAPAARSHAAFVAGQAEHQFHYQRPQVMTGFSPLVTILVPNYNHAPYLRQRLDSIFAQSWTNYEVLLMDDCSTDDSRAILQDYADRFPDKARVIFNEVNSGGVFHQWEKGLRAARGDLIWVAESDDWCSPNFLETLVPFFANQAVQLAYATTLFMNKDGTEQVWSLAEYLADLGPDRWHSSFVMTAPQIVAEGFAERNLIPNVSSAVFRRLDRLEVLENDIWRSMRTCGDWVFYLNQIRGGLIAFSPDAQNFYRQHPANTSVTSFSKDSYYIEHEIVAKTVQRHYAVEPSVFQRQHQNLILHWTRNRPSFVRAEFDACYALARITAEAARRKPKLLMAGFAFCSGGGETFPITLANVMKTAGYDITYLNCMQEEDIPGIRDQLARDIPVVTNFEDLNGILRDFDIDVIHSHHAWVDNTILDILPEDSPTKTVITLHGMYETLSDEQLKRTLPRLVKRTGAMVYIADKNVSALVSRGLVRAEELPRIDNALAKGAVTAVDRATLGIAADAFVLTVVSRAIAPKGWQEAIEAVARAREISAKNVHLILVGDGPEYDRLKGQVPPFVHLEGFRSNTRDYFATADAGLLPSRFKGESFPLVIIDCLHAGRPVISSDLGEIPYMLTTPDGVAGAMFALDDWQVPVEQLALIIADLARNRSLLDKMTALVPQAAKRFDPDLMRDRYDAVYQRVIQRAEDRQAAE